MVACIHCGAIGYRGYIGTERADCEQYDFDDDRRYDWVCPDCADREASVEGSCARDDATRCRV